MRQRAQAPGFYRYKVGTYECTSINDGARSFPLPDTFVTNVPSIGHVEKDGAGYRLIPSAWNPTI